MRKISIIIIFCLLHSLCHAQNKKVDSLKALLVQHTQKDTIRVKLLYSCCYNMDDNFDSANLYAQKGLQLAKDLKWNDGVLEGMGALANLLSHNNRFDTAISIRLEALSISKQTNNIKQTAFLQEELAEDYRMTGNGSFAVYYGNEFLNTAIALHNKEMELTATVDMANIYLQFNQKAKEKEYVEKALKLATALHSEYNLARVLELKANQNVKDKKFDEAVKNYRDLLNYWTKINSYPRIAWEQANLCSVFCNLKNKDSAGFYAKASFETATKHTLKKEIVDAYKALYLYAYTFGDYKKAIDYKNIHDSLYDNAFGSESARNIERTRLQYEQKEKDILARAQQDRKDAEAKLKTYQQFFILLGVIVIALIQFISNKKKQKANLLLRQEKEKVESTLAELKSTQVQLIQSEKMASLGELTAGIAHEIQNPLNFVNNFSDVNKELLAELNEEIDKKNYDEVKAIAKDVIDNEEKINHHGKRAESIVKGMLQHSRQTSGIKESTDINALADEYLRLSYHGLRAKDKSFNADFKTDFDESIGMINIVPQDIGRVLLNLYNNAFYATNEKQKLNIENYNPTVSITTKRINSPLGVGGIEIRVADNGSGIPQKIVEKIFQPFFTTKPTGQGTGLGLSLSYDIIKAHGGEISVQGKYMEGSEFIIQLPINL